MNSEYSFEHFQKRRKNIREKNKRTKRRLLMLFVTTFSTVLMMFLVIANLITPNIDIPALNNDYDKMTDMRSSDFKKRIDSRLEQIKVDDDSPARIVEKQKEQNKKTTDKPEEDHLKNFFANAEKIKDDIIKLDFSNNNGAPPVPNSSEAPEAPAIEINEAPQPIMIPKLTEEKTTATPAPAVPAPPKPYIPHAKNVHYKVLVGQFNSPEQARKLSESIARTSNSMVKPFIKNHNGKYCVQVGSYGNAQKAQSIATKYSSYGARVIND